jgi:hypothetical protein
MCVQGETNGQIRDSMPTSKAKVEVEERKVVKRSHKKRPTTGQEQARPRQVSTVYSPLSGCARFPAFIVTCRVKSLIGWISYTKPSDRRPLRQPLVANLRLYGWSLKGLYTVYLSEDMSRVKWGK